MSRAWEEQPPVLRTEKESNVIVVCRNNTPSRNRPLGTLFLCEVLQSRMMPCGCHPESVFHSEVVSSLSLTHKLEPGRVGLLRALCDLAKPNMIPLRIDVRKNERMGVGRCVQNTCDACSLAKRAAKVKGFLNLNEKHFLVDNNARMQQYSNYPEKVY